MNLEKFIQKAHKRGVSFFNENKVVDMYFKEAELTEAVLNSLLNLSLDWEKENNVYGYRHNEKEDIIGNRIFVVEDNGRIVGYLFGKMKTAENITSIIPDDTPIFAVDELYVKSALRSQGIGKRLFKFVEDEVKNSSAKYILLNTATKNFKSILHFYIDEVDMSFWSATLFKNLS